MSEPKYSYPDKLEIQPLEKPVNAIIRVPGSKSITNRALVLAALASRNGDCKIKGILRSDDTELMIQALRQLGFSISISEDGSDVEVSSTNRLANIPSRYADLYLGNSGTCMRFLAAMVSLGHGKYRLDGDARMRERPIEDLLDALRQLGADAKSENNNGCPPIVVQSHGLNGGKITVSGDVSSQFLSGLLMAAPLANADVEIDVVGQLVSTPYALMTTSMLREFSISVEIGSDFRMRVPGRQLPQWPLQYDIEPDATAASYFLGAAAMSQGSVRVVGYRYCETWDKPIEPRSWFEIQGDKRFLRELVAMGCNRLSNDGIVGKNLRGITTDMNAISDTVPTLAAVACFAEGPTTIRNVAHIRHKECDRISALCTELRKLGVEVEEYPDGLKITPRPMHGAEIETYNDHRIAMSMALIGLKVPGVVIKNPGCVAKTYPGYWEDFAKLYQ